MKVTSLYRRLKTPHNYQFVYITGCCRGTIGQVIMVMKHVKDVLLDRNGRTALLSVPPLPALFLEL